MPESIYEFALEPDLFLLSEDEGVRVASSYYSDSILAKGDLVSHSSANGDFNTHYLGPQGTTPAPQFLPRHLHG
jgi:hypothetical protein